MTKKIMIVGPYGGKNLGDDLILQKILESLKPYDVSILVSCSDPVAIKDLFSVETCPLLEYRHYEIESLRRIAEMDIVIIGGGEQLSEPRVINPFWGHLARTAHICRVARKRRVKVILWAVGLDRLRSKLSQFLLRRWLFREGVISCLRDEASIERARSIMLPDYSDLFLVADPAYALQKVPLRNLPDAEREALSIQESDKKRVLIVPAYDKVVDFNYLEILASFGRAAHKRGYQIYGWTTDLQKGYDDVLLDLPIWESIPSFSWVSRRYIAPDCFAAFISEFDLIVSARMHPIIVAQTQGVHAYVLARSAKMEALMTRFTIEGSSLKNLTLPPLLKWLDSQRSAIHQEDSEIFHARIEAERTQTIFETRCLRD